MDEDLQKKLDEADDLEAERKNKIAKSLAQNVCICKGIKLATFLRAAKHCKTVAQMNEEVGSGSGGCKGERCGPKIAALLERIHGKNES